MVGSFWSNMDPGGPPGTRVMTTFVTHVVFESANPCWWNLPKMLIWPSTGLILDLLLLSSPREIRIWVYQLWRMDFLQICWFSIESEWNRWEVGDFSKKVAIRLQRGAPLQLHSHRFDSLFLTMCTTLIDLIHFRGKVIGHGGAGELKASELSSLVRYVWEYRALYIGPFIYVWP